jgi:hypothetical protein
MKRFFDLKTTSATLKQRIRLALVTAIEDALKKQEGSNGET